MPFKKYFQFYFGVLIFSITFVLPNLMLMKNFSSKVLPSNLKKMAEYPGDNGWEILVGHSTYDKQCDPVTHYAWMEIEKIFGYLRFVEDQEIGITDFFNTEMQFVSNFRNHQGSMVTDGCFTCHDDILCISFRLSRGSFETYNVIFNYIK